jgi:ElaB/YqjD/DUF883 family membrane-anchored ribosome-binding protein
MAEGMYGSSMQGAGRESSNFGSSSMSFGSGQQSQNLVDHLTQFCKENPGTAAAWCFGIGFVLGWRLKPW